jgi:hypothetical protein
MRRKEGPEIEEVFLGGSKLRNMMIEEQMTTNSTPLPPSWLHKHTWGRIEIEICLSKLIHHYLCPMSNLISN